jgi:glycerophosphoryl diester phosphodiesterase
VVAHRGASAEVPENTLAAFERAVEVGADAVEFDVRLTRDGVAVVMHDPEVDRTTDGRGLVRDHSLAELKRLRVPGRAGHDDQEVPSLEEALAALSGRVAVDIEIKNIPGEPDFTADTEPVVDATLAALEAMSFAGPVLLSSFNPFALARVRDVAPLTTTGLLTEFSVGADAALTFAARERHAWVLPYVGKVREAGDGFADRVHGAGLRFGTWIVDAAAEAVALMRDGADAVATNDPAAVVAARRLSYGT